MKRLPIIRHVRYLYHLLNMRIHYRIWREMGYGDGRPRQADLDVLKRIWRGAA